jgi:hypothetical protein
MKNSSDTIGNRTRDLPACGTVPKPTVPPRMPDCLECTHELRRAPERNYLRKQESASNDVGDPGPLEMTL